MCVSIPSDIATLSLFLQQHNASRIAVCVTFDPLTSSLTLLHTLEVVSVALTASVDEFPTALGGHIVVEPWEGGLAGTHLHTPPALI